MSCLVIRSKGGEGGHSPCFPRDDEDMILILHTFKSWVCCCRVTHRCETNGTRVLLSLHGENYCLLASSRVFFATRIRYPWGWGRRFHSHLSLHDHGDHGAFSFSTLPFSTTGVKECLRGLYRVFGLERLLVVVASRFPFVFEHRTVSFTWEWLTLKARCLSDR